MEGEREVVHSCHLRFNVLIKHEQVEAAFNSDPQAKLVIVVPADFVPHNREVANGYPNRELILDMSSATAGFLTASSAIETIENYVIVEGPNGQEANPIRLNGHGPASADTDSMPGDLRDVVDAALL